MNKKYQDIIFSVRSGVSTITLNRPDKLNALRPQSWEEIIDALDRSAKDNSTGVVVITGAGDKAFCSGGDISLPKTLDTQSKVRAHFKRLGKVSSLITGIDKPVLCAVNGLCVGGGAELVLFCDLVIAAEGASFTFNGTKLGGCSWWGAPQLLPLAIGDKKAREILYFSRTVGAKEAERIGLVNKVVPQSRLQAEVKRWSRQLMGLSPNGLRLTKACINYTVGQMLDSMEAAAEISIAGVTGPETREAFRAFSEHGKVDWRKFRRSTG